MAERYIPPDVSNLITIRRINKHLRLPNNRTQRFCWSYKDGTNNPWLYCPNDSLWTAIQGGLTANEITNTTTTPPSGFGLLNNTPAEFQNELYGVLKPVVLIGDSITRTDTFANSDRMHSRIMYHLGGNGVYNYSALRATNDVWQIENLGIDSSRYDYTVPSADATKDWGDLRPTVFDTLNWPSGKDKILVLHLGGNDIQSESVTGNNCWDNRADPWIDACLAATPSLKIYICTLPPRTGSSLTTELFAFNTKIRNLAVSIGCHAVIDLASLSQFDSESDTANTSYYKVDGVHPNEAGTNLLAQKIAETILSGG